MTAEPAPSQRVVVLKRADHPGWYPPGYWVALQGLDVRMPALVENDRVLAGYLVAVDESEREITLTFSDLAPEE